MTNVETYQSMPLRLLEVVAPIQRIEPCVQEKLGPIASLQNEAALAQPLTVLRQDEINPVSFQVRECLDDAVWRHDGFVLQHQ